MDDNERPEAVASGAGEVRPVALHRWAAEIDYRHDDGIRTVTRGMHELADLHGIVEAGPNFYAITAIRIAAPRHSDPLTVEQAEAL